MRDSREYYLLQLRFILLTSSSFRALPVVQAQLLSLSSEIAKNAKTSDALERQLSFFLFAFVELLNKKIAHEFWLLMKTLHTCDADGIEHSAEKVYLYRLEHCLSQLYILFWQQYDFSRARICDALDNAMQTLTNEYRNWSNQQLWVTLQQAPVEQFSAALLADMTCVKHIVENCFSFFAEQQNALHPSESDDEFFDSLKNDDWKSMLDDEDDLGCESVGPTSTPATPEKKPSKETTIPPSPTLNI